MIELTIDKNDKNMVTNWGCNYTEMVILICSFRFFKLGFNHVIWSACFNFNMKEEDAESILAKQFSLHKLFQVEFSIKCLKIWAFLSVDKCSLIQVGKLRLVSPISQDWHPEQTSLYTAKDFRSLSKQSLLENESPVLKGEKTIFMLEFLQNFWHNSLIFS